MIKFAWAMSQRVRAFVREQRGSQTMEWLLLIGLVGFVVMGLITFLTGKSNEIGQAVWDLMKSWIDKVKPS